MSETNLKRCPFCGGEAVIGNENYSIEDKVIPCMYVRCMECRCKSQLVAIQHTDKKDFRKTYELLLKAWNRRNPMDDIVERLEELRKAEFDDSDEEPEFDDVEDVYDDGRSQGRYEAYGKAIKIVKGEV